MSDDITTPEQQAHANTQEAIDARARSLDASNVNLESGTGTVPVKTTATDAEIEHAKAVTGLEVAVGPLAEQDPLAAQVDLVADTQKAADEHRNAGPGLPPDHETPETPAVKPKGAGSS